MHKLRVLLKHRAGVKVRVKLPSFLSIPTILVLLFLEKIKDAKALKAFSPAVRLQDLWLQDLLTDRQCVLTETQENSGGHRPCHRA